WSLGGMLATQLAARRGDACRGLLTIASNPCFRARIDWSRAMAENIFDAFHEAFRLDPQETLKRFRSLCGRGGFDPRTLARQLQVSQSHEIGRASCRERVYISAGGESSKKKRGRKQ